MIVLRKPIILWSYLRHSDYKITMKALHFGIIKPKKLAEVKLFWFTGGPLSV